MKVADAIARSLALWGVRDVFGLAGSSLLPLLDAIAEEHQLRYHGVRHEESAALMASAQAKLTGNLGVCIAHAGPGAAHLVNGLYDAHKDRVPVFAITGQVPTARIGTDYKQFAAQDLMFSDCAGSSRQLASPSATLDLVEAALRYAIVHQDVAHIAVPSDLLAVEYDGRSPEPAGAYVRTPPALDMEAVEAALRLVHSARRPVILMGRGALRCAEETLILAERLGAPVITSLFAKGALSEDHPLVMGPIGEAGTDRAAQAAQEADLFLVLGSTWWPDGFMPSGRPVIQVDERAAAIGGSHPLTLGITAPVERVLPALIRRFTEKREAPEAPRDESAGVEAQAEKTPIHPRAVMQALRRHVPPGSVIAVDTGLTTLWYGRSFPARQETTLVSGRWRTMGFALPAAIGAKISRPEATVVALMGDGGFLMTAQELVTAVREKLPLVVLVLRNDALGEELVRQEHRGYAEFGMDLHNPDFAAFASACGAQGYVAEDGEHLEESLRKAFAASGPALIEVAAQLISPTTLAQGSVAGTNAAR